MPLGSPKKASDRFSRWFDRVLREEPLQLPTSDRDLAPEAKLAEVMEKGVDYDAYLRRLRRGDGPRGPLPSTVYRIGEALRACGVGWSGGLIALASAGCLAEFVTLLSLLVRQSQTGARSAAILAASCAVLSRDHFEETFPEMHADTKRRLRSFYPFIGPSMAAAWDALEKATVAPRRHLAFAPARFHIAYELACLSELTPFEREREVYEQLGRWVSALDDDRLVQHIAPLFAACALMDLRANMYGDALENLRPAADEPSFEDLLDMQTRTTETLGTQNTQNSRRKS